MLARNSAFFALIVLLLLALLAAQSTYFSPARAEDMATASATSTAIPTETPTVRPTFTATATNTAIPTATATATATARPTATATVTTTPEATVTISPMVTAKKAVIIDQSVQQMYVYEDGLLIRTIPVSTGKQTQNTFTPAWEGYIGHYVGTFTSFGTTQDEGWYLFKSDGNILIHGAPYNIVDGEKVYQEMDALGSYPASHGCIRISPEDAAWFTKWDPEGAYCLITAPPDERFR